MKVFVPNSNNVAKTVGKTLLALAISLNAHAYNQGQGQAPQKGLFEQAPGQTAQGAQQKSAPAPQAQSQCQGAPAQTAACASQAQAAPKGKGDTCAAACQQSHVSRPQWGSRCNKAACGNTAGGLLVGPSTQVNGWYLQAYQAHGVKKSQRDWNGSIWQNTQIDRVDLKKVNAENTVFNDVFLGGDFIHVKFNKSKMNWVTFTGTLRDVDFEAASLNNVLFQNVNFDSKHGHRNNFDGATLDNVRFEGGSLEKMTFEKAHLKDVTFDCAQIKRKGIFNGAFIYSYRQRQYLEIKGEFLRHIESMLGDCNSYTISSSDFFADSNGTL